MSFISISGVPRDGLKDSRPLTAEGDSCVSATAALTGFRAATVLVVAAFFEGFFVDAFAMSASPLFQSAAILLIEIDGQH